MNLKLLSKNYILESLAYLGVVLTLFAGTNLVKIHAGSPAFFVIKISTIVIVLGLASYFFYKQLTTNYLKLSLFIAFTTDYHLQYAFLILTIILFNKKLLLPFNSYLKPIYLLLAWGVVSFAVNQFIEFNPLSFPLFLFTFFLPVIFFGLFYNNTGNSKNELIEFFLNLVMITSGFIVIQFFLQPNLHPDYWNGGTPNAHIAAAYISIAFILSITKLGRINRSLFPKYFREIIIAVITFPILFLVDAKYFFILTSAVLILYYLVFSHIDRKYKVMIVGALSIFTVFFFSTPSHSIPISLLTVRSNTYNLNQVNATFINSPKDQLLRAVFKLPMEYPFTFIFGSGPGTFLSRADFIQHNMGNGGKTIKYNEGRENLSLDTRIAVRDTWIRNTYAKSFFESDFDPGSFYNRKSGLISIYFEMGIIGLILFVLFYLRIMKNALKNEAALKNSDNRAAAALCILLIMVSYFSYWSEYQNFCIIQYGVMGILLAQTSEKTEGKK